MIFYEQSHLRNIHLPVTLINDSLIIIVQLFQSWASLMEDSGYSKFKAIVIWDRGGRNWRDQKEILKLGFSFLWPLFLDFPYAKQILISLN